MSCKFKKYNEGCLAPYCQATNGECQFLVPDYEDKCEILNAFKDMPEPTPPQENQ